MELNFAVEKICDLWPELDPLTVAHYHEVAHYQDIPLNVDKAAYEALERAGAVRVHTARSAGRLVGYAIFFVRRNLHYSDSLQAVQDVLFLAPELRGGGIGLMFLAWCDERLREEGVQVVYHHAKVALDFGPLLAKLGYERIDYIYGRRLDGDHRSNHRRA